MSHEPISRLVCLQVDTVITNIIPILHMIVVFDTAQDLGVFTHTCMQMSVQFSCDSATLSLLGNQLPLLDFALSNDI